MHENASEASLFLARPEAERIELLESLSDAEAIALDTDWEFWARPDQKIPKALLDGLKSLWLPLAGRGWGKTRCGAEFVRTLVQTDNYERIALIGPTAGDIRDVMIEGESGLLHIFPKHQRPTFNPSKRLVTFHNGATGHTYSAEEPSRLRGPQHHAGWADEFCSWRYQEDTWDMYQFGLRLGVNPLTIMTTTPKPTKILKEIAADEDTHLTRGKTSDNEQNLAKPFLKRIKRKYEGTRLGRQELNAEILDDNPNSLFNRKDIEKGRVKKHPELARIVVAIDPAVTNNVNSDDTGIVAAGIGHNNEAYVLEDCTLKDDVTEWAKTAVKLFDILEADLIVGEVNNGGDLVEVVIRQAEKDEARVKTGPVAYECVRATRGKALRAEFLTLLYEQGRIHHVGTFPDLEDEMCEFDPTLEKQPSPNRLDALVWAMTLLFGSDIAMPTVRII